MGASRSSAASPAGRVAPRSVAPSARGCHDWRPGAWSSRNGGLSRVTSNDRSTRTRETHESPHIAHRPRAPRHHPRARRRRPGERRARRHHDLGRAHHAGLPVARSRGDRRHHHAVHGAVRAARRDGETHAGRDQHAEPRRVVDGVEGRAHLRVRPPQGRPVPQRRPGDGRRREVLLRALQGRRREAPQGARRGRPDRGRRARSASC